MERTRPSPRMPRWGVLAVACAALLLGFTGIANAQEVLDPLTLTKYIDPLPIPGAMPEAAPNYYEVGAWQIQQQLHSQLPLTTVYGYGPTDQTAKTVHEGLDDTGNPGACRGRSISFVSLRPLVAHA